MQIQQFEIRVATTVVVIVLSVFILSSTVVVYLFVCVSLYSRAPESCHRGLLDVLPPTHH